MSQNEILAEVLRRIDSIDYEFVKVEEDGFQNRIIVCSNSFFGKTINKRFDEVYDLINKKDSSFYRKNDLILVLLTLEEYQAFVWRGNKEKKETYH